MLGVLGAPTEVLDQIDAALEGRDLPFDTYIERYNRTVRYDWLSHYLFASIREVQDYATDWMWTYNHERPNMALGGITPKQKTALLNRSTSDHC